MPIGTHEDTHPYNTALKLDWFLSFGSLASDGLVVDPILSCLVFKLALSSSFPFSCLSKNPCCSMSCVPLGGMCVCVCECVEVSETYLEIESAVVMFSCTKWRPIQTILSTRSRLLCGFSHSTVHCAFDARCFTLEHSKVALFGAIWIVKYTFYFYPAFQMGNVGY